MRPVYFPQQNTILGRDQTEVNALPAFRGEIPYHPTWGNTERVISCYRLTDKDLEDLCRNKILWVQQILGKGVPLQPQLPMIESPFLFANGKTWDGKGNTEENYK